MLILLDEGQAIWRNASSSNHQRTVNRQSINNLTQHNRFIKLTAISAQHRVKNHTPSLAWYFLFAGCNKGIMSNDSLTLSGLSSKTCLTGIFYSLCYVL